MKYLILLIQLALLYATFLAVGVAGSLLSVFSSDPLIIVPIVVIIFGMFATAMWAKKYKVNQNYKPWLWSSIGSIILWVLVSSLISVLNQ